MLEACASFCLLHVRHEWFYGKMELILGTKIIDIAVQVANLVVFVGSCSKVAVL